MEERAFYGDAILAMIIPVSVEVIDRSCFAGCTALVSITFEERAKLSGSLTELPARLPLPSLPHPQLDGTGQPVYSKTACRERTDPLIAQEDP
jgi:hypothetical protein